ncbi:nucleotide sugar transporter SLC35D2 isoform X17 [Macaca fascicularis]|uniref:nucleotide sugar transporter SLC35D2 isoform X17 n=1 Tax=Macaca fascicularis TaxID=9541 RepID=UPI003D1588DF
MINGNASNRTSPRSPGCPAWPPQASSSLPSHCCGCASWHRFPAWSAASHSRTDTFPSPIFLGIGQMAATIMILYVSKLNKIIHFPDFDKKIPVKELGKYGVLFYNACFMIIPTLIISVSTGDLRQATEFNQWKNVLFILQFLLSCFLGFLLMYSTVLCSYYNSALTTAVVGAIKNVSVAYIGMLIGGDYIFSLLNFVGLNICMAGGLRYSFLTLSSQLKPKPVDEENIRLDLKS